MPKLTPAQMKAAVEEFKKKFTTGFYHGSPSNKIKEFDPNKGDRAFPTEGVTFVTRDPDFADSFLGMNRKGEYEKGSTIYPVAVNLGKHFVPGSKEGKSVIDQYISNRGINANTYVGSGEMLTPAENAKRLSQGDWSVMEHPEFLEHLKNSGYDTFTVMEGGTPNVGIFDPKNIRGKFAKFNPEDAESPDFMKANGGQIVSKLSEFLKDAKIPQRLYHGTTVSEKDGAQALSQLKQSKEGSLGAGIYMTPKPEYANEYANQIGGYVMPVHTSLKNPLVIHSTMGPQGNGDPMMLALTQLGLTPEKAEKIIEKAYDTRGYIGKEVMSRAQKQGYDGIAQYKNGDLSEVVSFSPYGIKSATGNTGEFNPWNPELSKAEGGTVQHFDTGRAVRSGLSSLANFVRHPHGQEPKVAQALEDYLKGNISQEERMRVMNQYLPMRLWNELPPNYTDEEIRNALMSNKQAKALAPVPTGARVGNRLDIPAYTQHGVYVDTTHDLAAGNAPISYNRTGHLKDVEFSSKPNQAVRVGLGTKEQALTPLGAEIGSAKSPFALIKGTNVGTSDEEVRRMMAEMLKDPRYTQIGMDPRKHSQFYDKATGLPVWSAEEKLQSGPLILAPKQGLEITDWNDPRLNLTDFEGKKYAPGGVVKKALEHARSLPFVHYSPNPSLTYLEPQMYGKGIKGAEAARLKNAPDIKPRSYFYVDQGANTRQPEVGLGPHKYAGVAEDIYPLHEDPAGFSAIAKQKAIDPYLAGKGIIQANEQEHLNELERLIKNAGYKGYANDDVGLLFHPTDVQKVTE